MRDTLELLLLIVIANAAPVIMSYLFFQKASWPVDFSFKLKDQQYLFGRTKTWRGLFASLSFTSLAAYALDFGLFTGLIVAALSMSGDLLSSFIKRRLGIKSSSSIIFLDQLPESIFPALFLMKIYSLALTQVIAIVISFSIIELILSAALLQFRNNKS